MLTIAVLSRPEPTLATKIYLLGFPDGPLEWNNKKESEHIHVLKKSWKAMCHVIKKIESKTFEYFLKVCAVLSLCCPQLTATVPPCLKAAPETVFLPSLR